MGSVFTCCQKTGPEYGGGITHLAPCTNIKNYWSANHSCASNIKVIKVFLISWTTLLL